MRWDSETDATRSILRADEELRGTLRDVFAAFGNVVQALVETGAAPPPLLQVEEVARWLGITERAVRDLIAKQEIAAVKVGRRWMVLRDVWLRELEEKHERAVARTHPRRRRP